MCESAAAEVRAKPMMMIEEYEDREMDLDGLCLMRSSGTTCHWAHSERAQKAMACARPKDSFCTDSRGIKALDLMDSAT